MKLIKNINNGIIVIFVALFYIFIFGTVAILVRTFRFFQKEKKKDSYWNDPSFVVKKTDFLSSY